MQITLAGRSRSDTDRLVGQFDVLGFSISFGVNRNRFDAHFAARALNAQRNFSAIGDKNFFKHGWCLRLGCYPWFAFKHNKP
jgi:hypothetical protein